MLGQLGFVWGVEHTPILQVRDHTLGNVSVAVAGSHCSPKTGVLIPVRREVACFQCMCSTLPRQSLVVAPP